MPVEMSEWTRPSRPRCGLGKRRALVLTNPPNHPLVNTQDSNGGPSSSTNVANAKHTVNKCLFGSGTNLKHDWQHRIDKTPMTNLDSVSNRQRAIDKPRRTILGKRFNTTSLLNSSSIYGDNTLMNHTKDENDINFSNCTFERITGNNDIWSVFKTKPYSTRVQQKTQTRCSPPKNDDKSVTTSKISAPMNRFMLYQSGVLESPKAPSPSSFSYRNITILEPKSPSPSMGFTKSGFHNKNASENLSNQSDQQSLNGSNISDDSSLNSFTENENTILESENPSCNVNGEILSKISFDDDCQGELSNKVDKESANNYQNVPKKDMEVNLKKQCSTGSENISAIVQQALISNSSNNILREITPMVESILLVKNKMETALETFLKEKSIFDEKLNALMAHCKDSLVDHSLQQDVQKRSNESLKLKPVSDKKKTVKVISSKLRRSIISQSPYNSTFSSPRMQQSSKLNPTRQFQGISSAAKAYNELRASYSILKTPVSSACKGSRSNCYTPHSLSVCIGEQMKNIFDS